MTKMSATSQTRYLYASRWWTITPNTSIADKEGKRRGRHRCEALSFATRGAIDSIEDHPSSGHLDLLTFEIRKATIREGELELWIPQPSIAKVRH